jgi:trans-feruloyl-CoA hydratase/vanillin synthase
MVNGYCFGGGFTQLIACDFALAAEEATFGLSEVNWGSFPGGLVSRVVSEAMTYRDALYYIMTGDTFTGTQAAGMRLVTAAYPLAQLRAETVKLANKLMAKNQHTLRFCKEVYKHVKQMDYEHAEEYMWAKMDSLNLVDPGGRAKGIGQFVDAKSYQPGYTPYRQD